MPGPRTAVSAAVLLAALAAPALLTGTAAAHPVDRESERARRTAALRAVAPAIPTVTSDNITQLSGIPETTAISMEFARTGPFAYVSSLDTISVLDLTDPREPVLRGTLVNALFENESMTYGERVVDGELQRFVIAAVDIVQASPDDPTHVNAGDGLEIVLVDVTDPDAPFIRSRTPTTGDNRVTTSTHTVQCVDQADCRYAYTAGTGSLFSIVDLTDLDNPRQLKTVASPASGPGKEGFANGAGHYWDFDGVLGWHTGSGGAAAFDAADPTNPVLVTATNALGRGKPINDFILHNSMRPNAGAFRKGAAPSIANGNVLLVTEEDYADEGDEIVCAEAGSFQTWYVPDLDGAAYRARNPTGKVQDVGTVEPLDQVNAPSDFGGGLSTPVSGFCSAHWFDVHQDGFVALGHYGAGMRILDVRNPAEITQFGYVTGLATQVWDAYWVPQRDAAGVAIPGQKTNLVYTADAVRGIEVYEVTLPARTTTPPVAQPPAQQPPAQQPPATTPPPSALPSTGPVAVLPLAALVLLGTALVVRRRGAAGALP
ncbi:MAG: hypothetical protein Q8R60_01785 [Mycobacteriales bacterium]|nr:hypothetical protein [Mycobacteriales bacterium]